MIYCEIDNLLRSGFEGDVKKAILKVAEEVDELNSKLEEMQNESN